MGNVSFSRRLIRRLTKNSSGTLSVSIPIEHAAALGWRKGQEVKLVRNGKQIYIKPISRTKK